MQQLESILSGAKGTCELTAQASVCSDQLSEPDERETDEAIAVDKACALQTRVPPVLLAQSTTA